MSTKTIPRGITASSANAVVGSYSALIRGTVDYWTGVLDRRATTLDILRDVMTWSVTALRRERPQWAHEHTIVKEWPQARLRDFSAPHAAPDDVPVLFLPPQAGHDSCIVDYAEGQSQVMTARAAGMDRVYAMDWIGATHATKDTTIDDYVRLIHETSQLLGGKINLVGDCQGGWLAVIYAGLHPDTVNTLTIAGAPIDYHAGEPLIHDWLSLLTPGDDMTFYKKVVARHGGILPGEFLLTGFMAMQPHNELNRQLQLLVHINEEEYVERYRRFETWFQWTQNIPGGFYLWIVEHLFKGNELIKGTLEVMGRRVDLADIRCPLYLLAGETDHITPPSQVYALEGLTSTPPEDVEKRLVPGGHLGLFMGHESLRSHWTPTFEHMVARSAHKLHL